MTLDELKEKGEWHGLFYVPFSDVEEYVLRIKLQFEEQLENAVNEAYDEGYLDALAPYPGVEV